MKKITCIFAFVIFSICSYASGEEMFAGTVPPTGSCQTYSSDALGIHHRICFDSVCTLLNDFIVTFKDDAMKNGMGGYIDGSDLKVPTKYKGENFKGWMFYNGMYDATFKDEYFLAYRFDSVTSMDTIPCVIENDSFIYSSSSPFVYPDSDQTTSGVAGFLSHMKEPEGPMNMWVKGGSLREACENFSTYFQAEGAQTNPDFCGFFMGDEIDSLLAQKDCVGMRYFYGYEASRKRDRIRIIFIGVDKNGENILVDPDNPDKEAIFLENEWPPSND